MQPFLIFWYPFLLGPDHIKYEHKDTPLSISGNKHWSAPRSQGSVLRRCEKCGDDYFYLATHQKGCGKYHQCSVCNLRFSRKEGFERHLKTHNPNSERFKCAWDGCFKSFADKIGLQQHIRGFHNAEKIACRVCGTKSTVSSAWRHLRKHSRPPGEPRYRCKYDGCSAAFRTTYLVNVHILYNHLKIGIECDIDGCGVKFKEESGWRLHLQLNHSGVEIEEHVLALRSASAVKKLLTQREKFKKGLCTVLMSCKNGAIADERGLIPACDKHLRRHYELKARQARHSAFKIKRIGFGSLVQTPDEMAACLSAVTVPRCVRRLARQIERLDRVGRVFCVDTEFARIPGKDGRMSKLIPVEIAVYGLDGKVVIDTLIKYDEPIEELLGDTPRCGQHARFNWSVFRRIYGQRRETSGMTIREIRDVLLNADMNSRSTLAEWSISAIDRRILGMILEEQTPERSILVPRHWRKVLPGFSTMSLSYFHHFLYPASMLYQQAHRAGPDTLMLINMIRALINLSRRCEGLQECIHGF